MAVGSCRCSASHSRDERRRPFERRRNRCSTAHLCLSASTAADGVVVPMPTLPLSAIVIREVGVFVPRVVVEKFKAVPCAVSV